MKVWESRCYSDGIPDEIPEGLSKALKAPSYKSIAIAILRNDMQLKSLGFDGKQSKWYGVLKEAEKELKCKQLQLML